MSECPALLTYLLKVPYVSGRGDGGEEEGVSLRGFPQLRHLYTWIPVQVPEVLHDPVPSKELAVSPRLEAIELLRCFDVHGFLVGCRGLKIFGILAG